MSALSRRVAVAVSLALCGAFASSCLLRALSPAPVGTERLYWKENARQDRLLVYLPGIGNSSEDFRKQGLWQTAIEEGLVVDVVGVDLDVSYYLLQSVADELIESVVKPARREGYREIWVVGNSLGALGALFAERQYPGTWDKIVLIAPYFRDEEGLFEKIEQAGGLASWQVGRDGQEDEERGIWHWLSDNNFDAELYLAYGDEDRFARPMDLLQSLVDEENTFVAPGGHSWEVWTKLWRRVARRIVSADEAAEQERF